MFLMRYNRIHFCCKYWPCCFLGKKSCVVVVAAACSSCLTSCSHSHRRIITKQECCYSVMGVRQNGFPQPLSTPFHSSILSDDQLDLNGSPAVLRDDDQHVVVVLKLANDTTVHSGTALEFLVFNLSVSQSVIKCNITG